MVWKITTDELLARYNAGERDFNGIELIRIPERDGFEGPIEGLEGANLQGINLRGANLEDIWFVETNLTRADLFGVCLIHASLADAILKEANLFSANLTKAVCYRADFSGAILDQINATDTSFIDATLDYFECAILAHANFQGAKGRLCLRTQGNLIWHTTMPNGTVEEGPYRRWN